MPVPAIAGILARQLAGELLSGVSGAVSGLELGLDVRLDVQRFGALRRQIKIAVIIACNRAAKPVKASVIAHAESVSRFGFLGKSIGSQTRVYEGRGSVVTVIGPKMNYTRQTGVYSRGERRGEPRKHIPYLYAWLLEKGTRRTKKKPFLQPAWDEHGAGYTQRVAAEIEAEVAKRLST